MTHQEILTKAIEKAIDGGWNGLPGRPAEDLLTWVEGTDYRFIFDHDFAKALWGDSDDERKVIIGQTDWRKWPLQWQYHLQQMVIADDPIAYLGDNI